MFSFDLNIIFVFYVLVCIYVFVILVLKEPLLYSIPIFGLQLNAVASDDDTSPG